MRQKTSTNIAGINDHLRGSTSANDLVGGESGIIEVSAESESNGESEINEFSAGSAYNDNTGDMFVLTGLTSGSMSLNTSEHSFTSFEMPILLVAS